jgi:cell division transport system permease protein
MARNATPRQPVVRSARRPGTGAREGHLSLRDRLRSWWRHHRASGRDALVRLAVRPAGTAMTVLVIAIALALPVSLGVLLENARALTQSWQGDAHLSVFLQSDLAEQPQRELAGAWTGWDSIRRTEVITPEQALAEYQQMSGFGNALDALPENPLPPLIIVYPRASEPEALDALRARLGEQDAVDQVQLDVQWVRRLDAMLDLGERLVSALALALALGVMLVLMNTIRLAIESRREEITVVKIVGGTDGFVRRPFLYTGFWYGAAGGLTAALLVQVALWWLAGPVDRLAGLYDSSFSLANLHPGAFVLLPVFAGILGLMGAWLAVGRHLREMEPGFF